MGTLNEGRHTGEYIVSEANGTRSRQVVTLLLGNDLEPGAVLGKVTASGKYAAVDPAAEDGRETAAAILYDAVDASTADQVAVVTARDSEVAADALSWKAGSSPAEIAAGVAALAAVGIIVR
ncbi:head decoration protein [Comamonadaceae bacterium PP-2]